MRNRTLLFLFSFLVVVISVELNQHARKVREIIAVWENGMSKLVSWFPTEDEPKPPVFTTKAVVAKRSFAISPATKKPTTKALPPTTKAIPARTILTTLTVATLPTQARTLRSATRAPTTRPVPHTPIRTTRSIRTTRRPAPRRPAPLPHWRKPKPKPFAKLPPKAARRVATFRAPPRRPAPPKPIRPFPPAPVRPFRPRQPVGHGDHPPGIRPPKGIALTLNLAKLKDFKTVAFRLLHRRRIAHRHV
ncbi:hypothetical protein WR25_20254 [Diploscapter pachys]|uniref:Spondin domain-containing protein n=1 Tax=Diploscapter pachys TaxID=2018661 RepID=A0A2A2LP94_9BILA|nr:hypothetical protein WR25_20254 [Diploscapter pachys]